MFHFHDIEKLKSFIRVLLAAGYDFTRRGMTVYIHSNQ